MRLRNVKNAKEIINNCSYVVLNPNDYKNKWNQVFNNSNLIYIEIGIGKGRFIVENAIKYPDINFIGIEKFDSVLVKSINRLKDLELSNLKLIRMDAEKIGDVFGQEISRIYLNFSDPWPKDKHAKRRLTSSKFLKRYEALFKKTIEIYQKTDNKNLFDFSLLEFEENNYDIEQNSYDKNTIPVDNIMTEYEERFLKKDNPIYQIKASKEIS